MQSIDIERVRDSWEKPIFYLLLILSIITFIIAIYTVFFLIFIIFYVILSLFAQIFFFALIKANGVQLNSEQYPEIYEMVEEYSDRLGLKVVPETYILQQTVFNAFAARIARKRIVVLYSELVEALIYEGNTKQLGFVIGHELGHHAAGHVKWYGILSAGSIFFPPLFYLWSRAAEYTCDRIGYLCVGDKEIAKQGLVKLMVGKRLARTINYQALEVQRKSVARSTSATILEWFMTHPHLVNRVKQLEDYGQHVSSESEKGEVDG